MYKRLFYTCTLAGALLANMSCTSTPDTSVSEINIIPLPSSIPQESGSFLLKDGMTIGISDKSLMPAAEYLSSLLNRSTGYHLSIQEGEEGDIQLSLADSFSPKEGSYSLHIDKKKVTISSGNYGGFIAGIQTIRQLFPAEIESMTELPGNTWTLPAVTITDEPRFSWRGVMLDVSRHFYSPDEVKELLDLMALYKLNKFHWHLTDDQGWRIEIKKYPKLTEVGAFRDSSEINHFHSNVFDGKPHGGFYTQDDIKEVVDYAAKRHIMIVPEIEMPGHASAAIASYPWLGTTGKQIKVPCNFGVHYNAYNVADPRVIQFQEDVLEEVIALFPSPVIHIGGDELRYNAWKESPMVRNYMKQNKITSPGGLQVFFTNNISNFLASKNRHMMGWNEITGAQVNDYQRDGSGASQQQLAPGTIVHFWKGEPELIKETIEKGYDIVNSYHIYTYLDYDYESIPLQKSYEFNPIPEGLTEAQQSKVLGIGCQMWGEFIPTVESMNKKIYPRLAAYAEVGWTNPSNKDFDRFRNSLNSFIGHWEKLGIQLGEWK